MTDDSVLGTCHELVESLAQNIVGADAGHDASEFFCCLGAAFARYVSETASLIGRPEIVDSFLEGFSSFLRHSKEKNGNGDSWVVDSANGNS